MQPVLHISLASNGTDTWRPQLGAAPAGVSGADADDERARFAMETGASLSA